MSSDMKKRTLRGRRERVAGCWLLVAGCWAAAFAAGRAVARAAPAALARNLRRLVVLDCWLLIWGLRGDSALQVYDAAEADVGSCAVGRVGGPRGYSVAVAIGGVAEKRAALHHLRLSLLGAGWVVLWARVEGSVEPVGAPLPDVSGH